MAKVAKVADRHEHVDLVTLEEVHRLLDKTDFASIDELASRAGVNEMAAVLASCRTQTAASPQLESGSTHPLPRRH